jgi:hypothetical protein
MTVLGMGVWAFIGIIGSAIVSIWAIMKFIVSQNFRLDDNLSKILIEHVQKSKYKFEINNEFSLIDRFPSNYNCFAYVNSFFIYFTRNERLLNAGWQSKDVVTEIYFLRWQKNKVESFLKNIGSSEDRINVMALLPYGSDKLGELSINETPEVFIDEELYEDIENDVLEVLSGNKNKTSFLLYGKPGTGKTRLIKYFSQKYKMPIYSIFLHPDYSNLDIISMFSTIPEKSIVLFEDFDNYFKKRDVIIKNDGIKFTFDSILNVLDGVYNDYKKCIFAMTCNNIENIDDSIKRRPSRMKFVREITAPSFKKRLEILNNFELSEFTDGMTLDKVFFAKSLIGKYSNEEIINIIEPKINFYKQDEKQ